MKREVGIGHHLEQKKNGALLQKSLWLLSSMNLAINKEQNLKEQEYFLGCYPEKERVQRMVMPKSLMEHGNLIKRQRVIDLFLEEISVMQLILLVGITTEVVKN